MKKIPLTQGKFALVDDCDYEFLSRWKWYAVSNRHTFYAKRVCSKHGKRVNVFMHQEIAAQLGFKDLADHINRNGLDNRRDNLRNATTKQQSENQGLRKDNKSGRRGVHWYKQTSKWQAQIGHNGKRIHLGFFDCLEDAIEARNKAEKQYFTHA